MTLAILSHSWQNVHHKISCEHFWWGLASSKLYRSHLVEWVKHYMNELAYFFFCFNSLFSSSIFFWSMVWVAFLEWLYSLFLLLPVYWFSIIKIGIHAIEDWKKNRENQVIWCMAFILTRSSRPIRCDVWIVEQMRYPTNRQTDRASDRGALSHLKSWKNGFWPSYCISTACIITRI